MSTARIVAFAGSARKDSFNKKLIRLAARAAEAAGAQVTLLDLRDYAMPLYDGDLEATEGIPEPARRFKQALIDHDGFLISCPEYNSSIAPALKNAIDWASRPVPGEPALVAYQGKVAGLMAASPGALGGLRGLVHVRSILGNIGVLVVPEQIAISKAHEAFSADGALKDGAQQTAVENVAKRLAVLLGKVKA
jgi:chromate reductase